MDSRLSRKLYFKGNGRKGIFGFFLKLGKAPLKTYDTYTASEAQNNGVGGPGSSGIPSIQIEDDALV